MVMGMVTGSRRVKRALQVNPGGWTRRVGVGGRQKGPRFENDSSVLSGLAEPLS